MKAGPIDDAVYHSTNRNQLDQNVVGISVAGSDYDKLKRYNLAELYTPTPKPQAPDNSGVWKRVYRMFIASSNLCDIADSEAWTCQNIEFGLSQTWGHNARISIKDQLLWARPIKPNYHSREENEGKCGAFLWINWACWLQPSILAQA